MKIEQLGFYDELTACAGAGVTGPIQADFCAAVLRQDKTASTAEHHYVCEKLPDSLEQAMANLRAVLRINPLLKVSSMRTYPSVLKAYCTESLSLLYAPLVEQGMSRAVVPELFVEGRSPIEIAAYIRTINPLERISYEFALMPLRGENWRHVVARPYMLPTNNKLLMERLYDSYAFVLCSSRGNNMSASHVIPLRFA